MCRYLKNADLIIEMDQGEIKAVGSPDEILQFDFDRDDAAPSIGGTVISQLASLPVSTRRPF